ncbi:hypothetical protein KFK09_013653 [Dendrobium nobile]|uniref:Uncharacterized protein n=1 Tax=Dendrobium nobile TaxID=94219 RepID=A0A8T3B9P0_DENNO|nr:hypothetical protein KFK09_013653 [Dendrobium nobile]
MNWARACICEMRRIFKPFICKSLMCLACLVKKATNDNDNIEVFLDYNSSINSGEGEEGKDKDENRKFWNGGLRADSIRWVNWKNCFAQDRVSLPYFRF